MEHLNDLNDHKVLPINQLSGNSTTTVQLSIFEGEHDHLQGPQPRPQNTEPLIVPGGVHLVQFQQMTAVAADQQLQFEDDKVVVHVESLLISEPGLGRLSIQDPVEAIMEPLMQDPQSNGSCLENFILGPNKSNPIWKLRLLCAICLAVAVVGMVLYPDDLWKLDKTPEEWAKFNIMVGVPIVVALISLVASCSLSTPHDERITGLAVANTGILVGLIACLFGLRHK